LSARSEHPPVLVDRRLRVLDVMHDPVAVHEIERLILDEFGSTRLDIRRRLVQTPDEPDEIAASDRES
jgi:hypothetical protein